jgi:signal transduction histidine kinase
LPGLAPVLVLADRERLQQIVLNLLTNAIKFTPAGGIITIDATCVGDSSMACVDVRDTGIGIPEDRIDAVFEPFVQLATTLSSRQDGIGLGLTISREFARGMAGDLTVVRGLEKGASFRLTLPLAQPPE